MERIYHSKYVCFCCRKMFKTHDESDRTGTPLEIKFRHPCPQCGEEMVNAGIYFKPPKQKDVEGWQVAEELVKQGYLYTHRGGIGYRFGYRPRTKHQLDYFLNNPPEKTFSPGRK